MAEKKDNTTTYIIVGGVLVLVIWDKIFGKSEEEKKLNKEEEKLEALPATKNPTNANYTITKKPADTIIIRTTKTIPAVPGDYFSKAVVALKYAIGTFTDDEAAIVAALKKAVTKSELALMVKVYNQLFKQDLFTVLKDNLNAKELLPIYSYITKLPDYIKGKTVK